MKKILLSILLFLPFVVFSQPPAGYYTTATGNCSALKTALKNIITNGNSPQCYTPCLWNQYQLTDIKPREVPVTSQQASTGVTTSANVIWDIYSDNPSGTDPYNFTPGAVSSGGQQDNGTLGTSEGQRYNREHSVPQSWFNGNTSVAGPATDYLIVYPTDKFVNGKRGDMPYAEVAVASQTFLNGSKIGSSSVAGITGDAANKVFEPVDSFKGDVARSFLYFITRYQDNIPGWSSNTIANQAFDNSTFPSATIPYLKLMLKWHHLDPVSQKEIDRNNGAYSFQGNRNPYIDHPEYVDMVWNSTCPGLSALPVDMIFFSGKLQGNEVQLNWEVATEINLDRYEVERSFNGTSYTKIGAVKAENKSDYSFTDNIGLLSGRRVYYRLKKTDKDGRFSYSAVFTLHIPLNTAFTVYPNPASAVVRLQLNNNSNAETTVMLTDIAGRTVFNKKMKASQGLIEIPVSPLGNGSYIVKLLLDNKEYSQRVLILK